MSQSISRSSFGVIFNDALEVYEKRTGINLVAHPLAIEIQECDSVSGTLTVLQKQVQESNKHQRSYMRWLNPVVKVLHAFSVTIGDESVCFRS
jgi:hypothetical protein